MWNVLGRRRRNRGVILTYHRVADLQRDPQLLAVSTRHFAEQVRVIADEGVALSLPDLLEMASRDALPRGATSITFDDGYADFDDVVPALAAAGAPATLFAATGALDTDREFWWDEIERHCLEPGELPPRFEMRVGGRRLSCDVSSHARWTIDDANRHAAWNITRREVPPTARHRLYAELCRAMKPLDGEAREQAIDQLAAIAGSDRSARATHQPLRRDRVAAIASAGGITIGSHTHSHPSLACLPAAAQYQEIASGRAQLESLTGRTVTSFAYPFGEDRDVSAISKNAARSAGVVMACTTRSGVVDGAVDRYAMPRVIVRDWPADEFRARWSRWVSA